MADKNFIVKNGLEVGGQEVVSSSGVVTSAALGGQTLASTDSPTFANLTVSNDLAISGDLNLTGDLNITGDVNSLSVTDLDVTDQTITLGAGQVESASGGSGIVVDGSGASILWDETNDEWDFNKPININGGAEAYNFAANNSITIDNSSGYATMEMGGSSGAYIDLKNPSSDDYDLRLITFGSGGQILVAAGSPLLLASSGNSNQLYLNSSGNVGIGVTPAAWDGSMTALQIDTGSIYANSNGATFIGANFYYDTTSNTNKYIESNPASAIGLSSGRVEFFVAGSGTAGNDVSFTEAMRIHSDGKVGIGSDVVSGPVMGLHVGNGAGVLFGPSSGASTYISPDDENTINGGYGLDSDTGDLWVNYRGYQNGTSRFRDFRVGNGKEGLVAIFDGSSGNVGIGTDSPVAKLHIQGAGTYNHTPGQNTTSDFVITSSEMTDNNAHSIMQLVSVRQSLSTGSGATGYLGFSTMDDSNAEGIRDAGRIAIVNETGTSRNSPTALSFWTNAGGTDTTAATEAMRILSSGNLVVGDTSLIGTNPTGSALNIFGDGVTLRLDGSGNSTKTILFRGTSAGNPGEVYADGGLRLRTEDSGMPIMFHTNSTGTNNERMRIDGSDGSVRFKVGAGDSGDSTTNTGSVSISNTDIDSDTTYTQKAGRYLISNGTGWGSPDGRNPGLVIHNDSNATNDRAWPGLMMHNENNTTSAYGPFIGWGARSASGEYNTTYAMITAKPVGTGVDANWRAGELELYTVPPSSYLDNKPGIRITSAGLVQQPKLYDSNGFFWLRSTSNTSGQSGVTGVVFTTRAQAGSGNTSTTTGRYTTPVDGVYHFSTNIRIDDASTDSTYFRIAFYTGTSPSTTQTSYGQGHSIYGPGSYSTSYFSMQTSWSVYLSAGTEVGVAVEMNTGTYTIHSESQFSGHLVG